MTAMTGDKGGVIRDPPPAPIGWLNISAQIGLNFFARSLIKHNIPEYHFNMWVILEHNRFLILVQSKVIVG